MNGKSWIRDAEVISGAVLAALGSYIFLQARAWVYLGPDGPGPGFFPTWYGVAMVALSLLLIANAIKAHHAGAGGVIEWDGAGRALATWAAFAASVVLLKPLGFAVSFALLTFFIVKVVFRRSVRSAALTAFLTTAAFELIFPFAMDVSLPVGLMGF